MKDILSNVEGLTSELAGNYKKISYSEMTTFQRCKRQYQYNYLMGLERAETPSYFSKGSYLHSLMAQLIRDVPEAEAQSHAAEQLAEEGRNILDFTNDLAPLHAHASAAAASILQSTKEVVSVEDEFYIDVGLSYGTLFHGFADAVIRNEEGELWLIEHKTASRRWSEDQFNFATQDILYAAALEEVFDEPIAGCTYVFYLPKQLDHRVRRYTPLMKQRALVELNSIVRQREAQKEYPMEPLWGCGGCPFQAVCRAEIAGGDVEYMLQSQFIVNEEKKARFEDDN